MKLVKTLLSITYAAAMLFGTIYTAQHYKEFKLPHTYAMAKPLPATPQMKASHRIKFKDGGLCTGTAVGPHAILTANHCNADDASGTVRLDLSTQDYHLLAKSEDGRDHVIYILDGPEFTNTVPLHSGDVPASVGEKVFMYGCGDGIFPPQFKTGKRVDVVNDQSEVDAQQGIAYYDVQIIPGDSGSALYADDGTIVAVLTYSFGMPKDGDYTTEDEDDILRLTADFDVNFTDAQIANAQYGIGDKALSPKPKAKPAARRPLTLLDLFGH